MTKAEYMALAESKFDELEALKAAGNFYEYDLAWGETIKYGLS